MSNRKLIFSEYVLRKEPLQQREKRKRVRSCKLNGVFLRWLDTLLPKIFVSDFSHQLSDQFLHLFNIYVGKAPCLLPSNGWLIGNAYTKSKSKAKHY